MLLYKLMFHIVKYCSLAPCYNYSLLFSLIFPGYYCVHVNSLVNDFTEVVDSER